MGRVGNARSDAALARAARAGEKAAFVELVRRHRAALLRVLRRHCDDPHELEDLYQETLTRALASLPRLSQPDRVGAWLHRLALHTSVDFVRQQRQERRGLALIAELRRADGLPPSAPTAPEERLPVVMEAVATVNPRAARALLLRGLEGLDYADIGHLLGATRPWVKTALHRVRRRLRNRLAWVLAEGRDEEAS